MAALTKFTISPSGQLVYKSSGKLAPEGYTFKKNTVYGKNGRRVGTLSRNLTKTQAEKIAKAERNRNARRARAARKAGEMAKPPQNRPRGPTKGRERPWEGRRPMGLAEAEEFEGTEFPEEPELIIEEFARRVKQAALSVAPKALQQKIIALSKEAIYEAYKQDAFIFETFFDYHSPTDAPHKSDVSVWLYQFVKRIETYMGVSS